MAAPRPLDLLKVDHLLSDDERDIPAAVREFVDERVRPHIADWFEQGTSTSALMKRGRRARPARHAPDGYGCAGTNAVAYGLACLELEAGDSGVRSLVSVQGSLAMFAIWKFGSEEQKQTWLPRMAAGEAIGCFGLTEPDFGSDPAGMRTRAQRDGDDWVLDGTKMWITNGSVADVAVVWAQTDDGDPRLRGADGHARLLRAEDRQEAVAARLGHLRARAGGRPAAGRRRAARGDRAARAAVLPHRGPLRHRLGRARRGPRLPGDRDRLRRHPRGVRPAAGRVPADPGEARRHGAGAAEGLPAGAAPRPAEGRRDWSPRQVSLGKLNNVREALAIARECRTILGANGITLEYPVMRHANNLESVLTYEGTSEVHQLVIGQALTGLSAFS